MGRPRRTTEARVSTQVRLPRSVHDRLLAAADERVVSVNWLVTRAVERFLDDLLPLDEAARTRRQEEEGRT
jgi:predicted HicB family RNase H-like nuclease